MKLLALIVQLAVVAGWIWYVGHTRQQECIQGMHEIADACEANMRGLVADIQAERTAARATWVAEPITLRPTPAATPTHNCATDH